MGGELLEGSFCDLLDSFGGEALFLGAACGVATFRG